MTTTLEAVLLSLAATGSFVEAWSSGSRGQTPSSQRPMFSSAKKQRNPKVSEPKRPSPVASAGSSRDAALAIVPPDQAWDTLQRARHYARDKSYEKWPPCLRLLHPFCAPERAHDLALCIASVVDKYQIEPFEIKLDQWSVIPHMEAMEADWKAMRDYRQQTLANDDPSSSTSSSMVEYSWVMSEEDKEARDLIAQEEEKGRQKLIERARSKNKYRSRAASELLNQPHAADADSLKALWEKQIEMYEEFNGPCVVCLEPDEESRQRIVELREILLQEGGPELQPYAPFAPTLTLSDAYSHGTDMHMHMHMHSTDSFRALIPVASFPTVSSAVEMARKLRSLWDPLVVQVTDLQIISTGSSGSSKDEDMEAAATVPVSWLQHTGQAERIIEEQVGCDAVIMLAGEELAMDDDLNRELANMIAREGISGGYQNAKHKNDSSSNTTNNSNSNNNVDVDNNTTTERAASFLSLQHLQHLGHELDLSDGDTSSISQWLDDMDNLDQEDEGTIVVIGRTHFFTGAMRSYVGMPATSSTDAKDKTFGSAAVPTRRCGTIPQSAGSYGQYKPNPNSKSQKKSPQKQKQKPRKRATKSSRHLLR